MDFETELKRDDLQVRGPLKTHETDFARRRQYAKIVCQIGQAFSGTFGRNYILQEQYECR